MEQNLSLNHLGNSKQVKCCKHENIPILCWQFNGGYPDTFRSIRIHSNSFKFIQIQYIQIHPDPFGLIQIYPDRFRSIRSIPAHPNLSRDTGVKYIQINSNWSKIYPDQFQLDVKYIQINSNPFRFIQIHVQIVHLYRSVQIHADLSGFIPIDTNLYI